MSEEHPKLFISYSWTTPEHEQWVLDFATELRDKGIDVKLDKWDLKKGQDINNFMELMVKDEEIKKVLMICDKQYKEKANSRKGGAGTEATIISKEVYQDVDQEKFVALIKEVDANGNAYLPIFCNSRNYIDYVNQEEYKAFEEVVRWVYDKPLHEKPPLGNKPAFLDNSSVVNFRTRYLKDRASEAIRNGKSNAIGLTKEYFQKFAEGMKEFKIEKFDKDEVEDVLENIEQFLPYTKEFSDFVFDLANYLTDDLKLTGLLKGFFELVFPYMRDDKECLTTLATHDNFCFIIYELYVYTVAILLKENRFGAVSSITTNFYFRGVIIYPDTSKIRGFLFYKSQ